MEEVLTVLEGQYQKVMESIDQVLRDSLEDGSKTPNLKTNTTNELGRCFQELVEIHSALSSIKQRLVLE